MAFKPDMSTRRGRATLWFASRLVRAVVGVLGRTWRIDIVHGRDVYEQLLAESSPSLLALWHNRVVMGARYLVSRFHRRGRLLATLASESRDGELVTGLMQAWGLQVVRGSTTRGGRRALWGLLRAIRAGRVPVIIPDGPVGPIYEVKDGVLFLSQATGTPIVPLGFAADRAWRVRSWDRLIVPKPFARVSVAFGEPRVVPSKGDGDGDSGAARAVARHETKEAIDEMTRLASAAVGRSFPNAT